MRRGDVVIAVHGDFGRPRPAIVVQADELGNATTTVIVCPVTSDLTDRLPIRPIVDPSSENGLSRRSQIMTDKLLALPRERVRRVAGSVDTNALDRLDRALLVLLGLAR